MYLKYKADKKEILKEIDVHGFYIMKSCLSPDLIDTLKEQCFRELSDSNPLEGLVWTPYIGEKDKTCYSDDSFQCMFRGYNFPWNVADNLSLEVMKELDAFRNLFFDNSSGLSETSVMNSFATWSYYPPNKGWLGRHSDVPTADGANTLIHFLIPLTFKGSDYNSGGLYIINSNMEKIDVDSYLSKGDVIFYNGKFEHGVDKITSNSDTGRMQIFSIPLNSIHPIDSERLISSIKLKVYIKSKFNLFKVYLKSRFNSHQDNPYN